ncbi:hypothetical protein ACJBQ0_11865, partial [Streptococcus suis]
SFSIDNLSASKTLDVFASPPIVFLVKGTTKNAPAADNVMATITQKQCTFTLLIFTFCSTTLS